MRHQSEYRSHLRKIALIFEERFFFYIFSMFFVTICRALSRKPSTS